MKSNFSKPPRKHQRPQQGSRARPDPNHPKLEFDPGNDLIYGAHPVAAAAQNPRRQLVKLWATENGAARLREDLSALPLEPELVHPRLLDHLLKSADAVHQGVILEARPLRQPRLDQIPREGFLVVLDQVTDPHNVGAIMRSCAAFGVTALVATARNSPAASGVLFKAASGAFEHVPYVTVTNLARALEEIKSYGFALIGLDSAASHSLEEISAVRPLGLVLGAEGRGLRQLTRETCDHLARIDMPGAIKSLNVSIAAAISLYALRKR